MGWRERLDGCEGFGGRRRIGGGRIGYEKRNEVMDWVEERGLVRRTV